MKILIWIGCFFVTAFIQALFGIKLGGIPAAMFFGATFCIAKNFSSRYENRKNKASKKYAETTKGLMKGFLWYGASIFYVVLGTIFILIVPASFYLVMQTIIAVFCLGVAITGHILIDKKVHLEQKEAVEEAGTTVPKEQQETTLTGMPEIVEEFPKVEPVPPQEETGTPKVENAPSESKLKRFYLYLLSRKKMFLILAIVSAVLAIAFSIGFDAFDSMRVDARAHYKWTGTQYTVGCGSYSCDYCKGVKTDSISTSDLGNEYLISSFDYYDALNRYYRDTFEYYRIVMDARSFFETATTVCLILSLLFGGILLILLVVRMVQTLIKKYQTREKRTVPLRIRREKIKFCKYCGTEIDADSVFCSSCGKRISSGEANR